MVFIKINVLKWFVGGDVNNVFGIFPCLILRQDLTTYLIYFDYVSKPLKMTII